jgi:hypothetical protein
MPRTASSFISGFCECCKASSNRCPDANGTFIGSYKVIYSDLGIEERTSGGGVRMYRTLDENGVDSGIKVPAITLFLKPGSCLRMRVTAHYTLNYGPFETVVDGELQLVTLHGDEIWDNPYGIILPGVGSFGVRTGFQSITESGAIEKPKVDGIYGGYCEERFAPFHFGNVLQKGGVLLTWHAETIEYIVKLPETPQPNPLNDRPWTRDSNGNVRNMIVFWDFSNIGAAVGITIQVEAYAIGNPFTDISVPDPF